jgi:acetyltransferase-like isoleucine patch superfamily enzyme
LLGARIHSGYNVFIDDRVLINMEPGCGPVEIGDRVKLFEDTHILVGSEGSVQIGAGTSIHRGCQIEAYKAPIRIGRQVEIAPRCAFQSFDHGIAPDQPIAKQPLTTKGAITIEDEVWLGHGSIVLSGVRIGKGAVIGAGSVVTRDVPAGAIAVGVPARVVRMRSDSRPTTPQLLKLSR